jgi:putative peptidoglycan lipid II flippase
MTLSSGIAGWCEYALLRKTLNKIIGNSGPGIVSVMTLYGAALSAALAGWGVKLLLSCFEPIHPVISGACILGIYATVYILTSSFFGISEAQKIVKRVFPLFKNRQ